MKFISHIRNATVLAALAFQGCGTAFTDPATRLAAEVRDAAKLVAQQDGARHTHIHRTPSRAGECEGPYRVQLDESGALVVWCKSAANGETVSSHSTSAHAATVSTRETFIVDKRTGEDLVIELARIGGKVTIIAAR
ncbi:MAG: hypothetical protein SF172_15620 [Burkholderiales bacterium]|nr:hypothetical protein [Burkholderiales bacterium]